MRSLMRTYVGATVASSMLALPSVHGQSAQPIFTAMSSVAMPAMGQSRAPAITQRSLEEYATILGLDEEQRSALKLVHEGYNAEHGRLSKAAQERTRELMASFRESGDAAILEEELPKVRRDSANDIKKVEASFFDDMRALLSAAQQDRFERVERHRRRELGLRGGMISGEGVDVTRIVGDMQREGILSAEVLAALAPTLDAYEADIDRAIQERDLTSQRARPAEGGMRVFDPEDMREQMDQMRRAGQRIREINESAARRVEPLLPEAVQPAWAQRFERACFPEVYRQTHAERCLEAAAGYADLSSDQRALIEDAKASYLREREGLDRRWVAAIREREANGGDMVFGGPGGEMMMISIQTDDEQERKDPLAEARKARRELDDRAREKLASVLTQEQRDRLPKREESVEQTAGGVSMQFMQTTDVRIAPGGPR